jgi:hypothetical protein
LASASEELGCRDVSKMGHGLVVEDCNDRLLTIDLFLKADRILLIKLPESLLGFEHNRAEKR